MTPTPLPATPLPAATILVCRKAGPSFELFLVKRHGKAGFMAGAHVFPGGRLNEDDARTRELLTSTGATRAAALVDHVPAEEATLFCIAAVRETAEECGVLLARDAQGRLASAAAAMEVFERLKQGAVFSAELEARGLVPALDCLETLSWWITPEAEPRRFNTRFFVASSPADQVAASDQKETTEGEWLAPGAALEAYRAGRIALAPPTFATLEDLAAAGSIEEALRRVARPLRPICPVLVDGEHLTLALPGDVLHPERERVGPALRTRIVLRDNGFVSEVSMPS